MPSLPLCTLNTFKMRRIADALEKAGQSDLAKDCHKIADDAEESFDADFIEAARNVHHEDGSCEIDDGAVCSIGDIEEGCYVQAWVWISADDIAEVKGDKKVECDHEFAGGVCRSCGSKEK